MPLLMLVPFLGSLQGISLPARKSPACKTVDTQLLEPSKPHRGLTTDLAVLHKAPLGPGWEPFLLSPTVTGQLWDTGGRCPQGPSAM